MLRPTTLGLALMQAASKIEKPQDITRQILWRGENTNAGVIFEPNGPREKVKSTETKVTPEEHMAERMALQDKANIANHRKMYSEDEPPFDTELQPSVAEIAGEEEEDFYEVQVNPHGFPQTYQRNSHGYSSAADSPVCSQCQAAVMPNRGQGTACDSCQHEFLLECQHDYDTGEL